MDLNKIKALAASLELKEETSNVVNAILDSAISQNRELTQGEKEKVAAIVDLEIDWAELEADAREEMAIALDSFVGEIESVSEIAESNLNKLEEDMKDEVDLAEKDTNTNTVDSPDVPPTPPLSPSV